MFYFLVYDDDTHTDHLHILLESVKKYDTEFEIVVYKKTEMDKECVLKHESILSLKRGGGYWLWKPYIIHQMLQKIKEGDVVFYLDSKYYFTETFTDLYSGLKDILVWKNKPNETKNYMKHYCKMNVILKYNMYEKVFIQNAEDCWAGAIVIKKTDNTVNIVKEWLDMCCVYEDITDQIDTEDTLFRDHRHDQSLLSIVLHKYDIQTIFFETKYLQNTRIPY